MTLRVPVCRPRAARSRWRAAHAQQPTAAASDSLATGARPHHGAPRLAGGGRLPDAVRPSSSRRRPPGIRAPILLPPAWPRSTSASSAWWPRAVPPAAAAPRTAAGDDLAALRAAAAAASGTAARGRRRHDEEAAHRVRGEAAQRVGDEPGDQRHRRHRVPVSRGRVAAGGARASSSSPSRPTSIHTRPPRSSCRSRMAR